MGAYEASSHPRQSLRRVNHVPQIRSRRDFSAACYTTPETSPNPLLSQTDKRSEKLQLQSVQFTRIMSLKMSYGILCAVQDPDDNDFRRCLAEIDHMRPNDVF